MSDEQAPQEAFSLRESVSLQEGALDPDGTVGVHIIRPGIGRGRGRHLYEPQMLAENAHKFTGWRMYVDHLSPEARRKAGGLPRSMHDIGGIITESRWDPNVPADPARGFGQGAVVGRAKPVNLVKSLIEEIPQVVEASICANATGVRAVERDGQRVWLVEGIEDKGSVDWVTEGGAGGRVVALMEALMKSEPDLNSLTDNEFVEYLREQRPELVEALTEASDGDAEDKADGGADEEDELVKKYKAKGMPDKMARAAAKKAVSKMSEAIEGDEMEMTPEVLQEALTSDSFREQIDSLVEARMQERLEEAVNTRLEEAVQQRLQGLVEAALEDERELIHEEASAKADRQIELRDMRDLAHKRIEEARLPEPWKVPLRGRFDLVDGRPTSGLDQIDEVDENGAVTKPARVKVEEAVAAEIATQRELLAAARPTVVRGQGPTAGDEEKEDKGPKVGSLTANLLQEAGIDPEQAWAS